MVDILGVKQRGSTQWSEVTQNRPGQAPARIGNNFALLQLTGASGSFIVGATLTEASSGVTAKVTAVTGPGLSTGASPTMCINTLNGAFTGVGTIVASSGGSGTWDATIALEYVGIDGNQDQMSRVTTFKNKLYVALNNYIWLFDGTNWAPAYALVNPNGSSATNCVSGLYVFNVGGAEMLGCVYGQTTLYRVRSFDGTNFYEATLAGTGLDPAIYNGVANSVVWQNVLYFIAYTSADHGHCSWDPNTDGYAEVALPTNTSFNTYAHDMFVFQSRLFQLRPDESTSRLVLFEFTLGSYSVVMDLMVPADGSGAGLAAYIHSKVIAFDDGSGNLILRYFYSAGHFGWIDRKLTYSGTTFTDAGEIQSLTLDPNLAYPNDVAAIGSGGGWGIHVDTDSVPGTQIIYFWLQLNDLAGTQRQYWQWVDSATQMQKLGVPVGDVNIALPQTRNGGGERVWTLNQPGLDFRGYVSPDTAIGPRAIFAFSGGGTKTVKLYWGRKGQAPTNLCTLDTPSRGTIGGGNTLITAWPADGTVGQVTWNSMADGVPSTAGIELLVTGY